MLVIDCANCLTKCWKTPHATHASIFSPVSKALLYALVAACGNVLGALAVTRRARLELEVIEHLLAFGAGFMLSVAMIELLPEAFLRSGALAWIGTEAGISLAESGSGIARSVAACAGGPQAPFPLLVTTADHALLTVDMVESFLANSAGTSWPGSSRKAKMQPRLKRSVRLLG